MERGWKVIEKEKGKGRKGGERDGKGKGGLVPRIIWMSLGKHGGR